MINLRSAIPSVRKYAKYSNRERKTALRQGFKPVEMQRLLWRSDTEVK